MVTKIIKTHSLNNGNVKKTLTFSTEENKLSNETQTLPFNQSPAAYGFFGDLGDFFKKAGDTFVGGFKKLGDGIVEGDFKKILEGIGEAGSPGIVAGVDKLSSPTAESSYSPDIISYSELIIL